MSRGKSGAKGGGGSAADFLGSMWTSVVGDAGGGGGRDASFTEDEGDYGTELGPYSTDASSVVSEGPGGRSGGAGAGSDIGDTTAARAGRTAFERNVLRVGDNERKNSGRMDELRGRMSNVKDSVVKAGAAALHASQSFQAAMSGTTDASRATINALRAEKRVSGTEYVFVFDASVKVPKVADERRTVIGSLRQVGLIVDLEEAAGADQIIAKVSAPYALLMWWAERIKMRVELKSFQEYLKLTLNAAAAQEAAAAIAQRNRNNEYNNNNNGRGGGRGGPGGPGGGGARGVSGRRGSEHVTDGWEGFDSESSQGTIEDGLGIAGRDSAWNGGEKTGLDKRDPGTAEYTIRHRELFRPLRSSQRQRLVDSLIQSRQFEGGANLDIETMVAKGYGGLEQVFPMHDEDERSRLLKGWVRISNLWRGIPVNDIRDYFGESIAFYFAFISFYMRSLALPSLFGVAVFVTSIVKLSTDNSLTPAYSGFIALWVTVFLEFWKRRRNLLCFRWDMVDFQQVDKVRPQFHGVMAPGFFSDSGFVKLRKRDVAGIDIKFVRKEMYTRAWKYRAKLAVSYAVTFFLAGIAITCSLMLLWVRMWLIQEDKTPSYQWEIAGNVLEFEVAAILAGVLNGLAIAVLNFVSRAISYRLTAWENHRTESQYQHHLAIKLITFQVINSYFSLFYIAFFKKNATIFGRRDACSPDCMTELSYQLATVFLTREFVAIAQQGMLPMVTYAYVRGSFRSGLKKRGKKIEDASPEEIAANMLPAEELMDDWVEVSISFGFICFVSAFPIVPLLACIGTFIEIGLDTRNLLKRTQRARYLGANGIGVFYEVFNGLGLLAVITNALIFGVVSNQLNDIYELSPQNQVWAILIVEHTVILAKLAIMWAIPDVPKHVRRGLALRKFQKNIILGEGDIPGDEWVIDPAEVDESTKKGGAAAATNGSGPDTRI